MASERQATVAAKNILLNGYVDRVDASIISYTDLAQPFIKAGTEIELKHFKDRAKDAPENAPDALWPKAKDLFECWANSRRCDRVSFVTQEVAIPTEKKAPAKPTFIKGD